MQQATRSDIILIGPIGTGKSTLGRLLAAKLGLPQVSMDDVRWDYYREIGYGKHRVPIYRLKAAPLTGVKPIPESGFTGRSNLLFALEVEHQLTLQAVDLLDRADNQAHGIGGGLQVGSRQLLERFVATLAKLCRLGTKIAKGNELRPHLAHHLGQKCALLLCPRCRIGAFQLQQNHIRLRA